MTREVSGASPGRPPVNGAVVAAQVGALAVFVVALAHLGPGPYRAAWWTALVGAVLMNSAGAAYRYRQLRPARPDEPRFPRKAAELRNAFVLALRWLWRSQSIDLSSPLSLAEVHARVAADLTTRREGRSPARFTGSSRIIVGRVVSDRVRLQAMRRDVVNSFTPVLEGRLVPAGHGCRLVGRLGFRPVVRVFVLTMGVVLAAVVVLLIVARVIGPGQGSFLAAMLGWGGGLLYLPLFAGSLGALGVRDARFLLDWLRDAMGGRDA